MHKDFYVLPPLAKLQGVRLAVAHLVIQGYTAPQIACQLCLSLSSIKKYIVALKEQMNCQTLHGLSATLTRLSLEQNPKDFLQNRATNCTKDQCFFHKKREN